MTPKGVETKLAVLREAGRRLRERPAAATLDAVCGVLDGFRDPRSPWRARLEAELPRATGFSPAAVREGLARALAEWSGGALRALVARELGGAAALEPGAPHAAVGFDSTAVLLAGSIPMPTLLAMVSPLVLLSPALAKPASRDPVTPRVVAAAIAAADPVLGECIALAEIASSDAAAIDALLAADCVAATGSDATIARIAARVAPPRRLVAAGHRLSLAAVGPAATRGEALAAAAEGLALDVALWDQQGCLSPIAVLVASDGPAADRVAAALAAALEQAEKRWPRGRIDARSAAAFAHERDTAELRAAAGRPVAIFSGADQAWCVVREEDAAPRPAPLHRFVRVAPVDGAAALVDAIAPISRHLAGVAVAGFAADETALAAALIRCGASRICAPGTLQTPPLDWRHEGRGVLTPLARFADREAPRAG
jgi:hypothetical protein